MTRVALLAALVFLAGSAPNAVLPSAQWAEKVQGAAQPGPRSQPALLFHDRLRKLVLLDGTYSAVRPEHSEIWIWDGRAWALIPSTGPTGRYASAAVYDSRRDRIVSFSGRVGRDERITPDTWEWDGQSWTEMRDTSAGARDHHMMAYDAARGRTVMYGGGPFPRRPGPWATDTWEWDGTAWRQVGASGPLGRVAAMVYDAARRQVLMFGGVGAPVGERREQPNYGDTWSWDGASWRKLSDAGPSPRDRHAMAFDSRAGVVLLYGGETRSQQFDDMWKWDGRRWSRIALTGATPGKRSLHAMAYDPVRDRTVLFGGNNNGRVVSDTWEWDGRRWTRAN